MEYLHFDEVMERYITAINRCRFYCVVAHSTIPYI